MIRLVGGPRMLDGSTHDLSSSAHDRADADDTRFVRAVRDSTAVSLSGLRARCADRAGAEELARTWRAAAFTPGRARRFRPRLYRFEGTYRLEPGRDRDGRWTVTLADRLAGPPPRPAASTATSWTALEAAVDRAATRFTRVAALLPDGPFSDRADATRWLVAADVADAARLCAVGHAVAPDWRPGGDPGAADSLAERVGRLVGTIDAATAHLVDLHLEIGGGPDATEPVAHLAAAWVELDGPRLAP
jgi:hypothetical protein